MPSSGEKSVYSTSTFTLPDDWSVVEKKRGSLTASPGRVDKYYCEPGTGKMFRSLISVHKYLREGKTDTPMTKKLSAFNKSSMQIIPHTIRSTSPFILPDDWIIEEKHRSNANYAGVIDRYYIEPGSGQRFRSLRAVERYLTEANEDTMPLKAFKHAHELDKKNVSVNKWSLKVANEYPTKAKEITTRVKKVESCNHSRPLKHSGTLMKNNSGEDVQDSMTDFSCQPSKINWVLGLAGPGGNMWSPFMGEYLVPESVKQKWSETFISSIQKGSLNGPGF